MTKLLVAALLSAFLFSSLANANERSKIEPIRIAPKQERNVASEDDGFIPAASPAFKKKALPKKAPTPKIKFSKKAI